MPAITFRADKLDLTDGQVGTDGSVKVKPYPKPVYQDDGLLVGEVVVPIVDGTGSIDLEELPAGYAYTFSFSLTGLSGTLYECRAVGASDADYHDLELLDRTTLTAAAAPPAWTASLNTEATSRAAADTTLTTAVGTKLAKASNLSDLVSASTARTNLGLGNVTNTADADKPVSTAQAAAITAAIASALAVIDGGTA